MPSSPPTANTANTANTADTTGPLPWPIDAACACALTSAMFTAIYWLANHLTSLRNDVGAMVFAWECGIPFIPWTIVPYLSIGAFFAMSFFVDNDPVERRRHVVRLMAVLMMAVVCYGLFPQRFTFERPAVQGAFRPLFDALVWFDRPYNRAPSLHVAVLVALWARLVPALRRWQGWCLRTWFLVIGVSVLTTYQHHVVDVLAGVLAGAGVLVLTAPAGLRRAEPFAS
jgi:membrane-associated phospholipid phosphatase